MSLRHLFLGTVLKLGNLVGPKSWNIPTLKGFKSLRRHYKNPGTACHEPRNAEDSAPCCDSPADGVIVDEVDRQCEGEEAQGKGEEHASPDGELAGIAPRVDGAQAFQEHASRSPGTFTRPRLHGQHRCSPVPPSHPFGMFAVKQNHWPQMRCTTLHWLTGGPMLLAFPGWWQNTRMSRPT